MHLASTPNCPNQAFRFGERCYGLQFHLEVDQDLIDRWLTVPVHKRELQTLGGKVDPERIRGETIQFIGPSMAFSDLLFGRYVDLFRLPPRRRSLPSR